jgi:hypothetical protein
LYNHAALLIAFNKAKPTTAVIPAKRPPQSAEESGNPNSAKRAAAPYEKGLGGGRDSFEGNRRFISFIAL